MKRRARVIYSGRVQGVGFRFVAQSIAGDLNISGWVKNLSDGRVEVVAEGEEKMVLDYLSRIQGYFGNYIRDIDSHWQDAEGNMEDFGVKF